MSTKVYNAAGALIRESANLRGLLDHARRAVPQSILVGLADVDGNYPVRVDFHNGDHAWTKFADWRVCADWFASRRSWGRLEVAHANMDFARRYAGHFS